ncbi:MAG: ATP-binding cassette domain-containing protein [Acidimicrobiia bacterium]
MLEGHGLAGLAGPGREGAHRTRRRPFDRQRQHLLASARPLRGGGGYSAESEVRRLAAGVGLGADRLDLPLGALSGGERRRLELVRILFTGSELLLLDEPTNHLDADARTWLLKLLRAYRGATRRNELLRQSARIIRSASSGCSASFKTGFTVSVECCLASSTQ